MENCVGKVCPYCKTEIKDGESVKICPACDVPHHEACWTENGGCTTFGCTEQVPAETPAAEVPVAEAPANVCATCGAVLNEGDGFCPNCGTKATVSVSAEVNEAISQFNAGVEQQKKKTKMLPIIIAIAVAIAAIATVIGISVAKKKKLEEEIARYRTNASLFYDQVLDSGVTMEDIGNEILASWKAYVKDWRYNGRYYYSVDSAIDAALSYMDSEVDEVKAADSLVDVLYAALMVVPDPEDQALMKIKEEVEDTYEAYEDMYECVITPSGSYNTWTDEFSDVDTALGDAIKELRMFVQ